MGLIVAKYRMLAEYLKERKRTGLPVLLGDPSKGVVILVDGVGGVQLTCVMARKAFREVGLDLATYLFDWHIGPTGEMLVDLAWRRRNQYQALRLARLIGRFRREHPQAPLHVLAHSGGCGIAVFAAEQLRRRSNIDRLILGAPALSPDYPLGGMLWNVERCYVFYSRHDRFICGLGTTLFGTIDRRFGASAGMLGFRLPQTDGTDNPGLYEKLHQIPWSQEMSDSGHVGQHTGPANCGFIRDHVVPLLRD